MNLNRLCTAFRQIALGGQGNVIRKYFSSYLPGEQNNTLPPHFSNNTICTMYPETHIRYIPRTLNLDFVNPDGIRNKNIIEIPFKKTPSMEEPLTQYPVQRDLPVMDKSLELPSTTNVFEKIAVNMILIRRRKMKKHKRRKLRKRMKYIWEKIRLTRNIKKEKLFQAELIAKVKKANEFDPKAYVNERLDILLKERIPKTYRGEILPPQMIKKFLEEKQLNRERKRNKLRLKLE
ncbi:uncharacterized protein LOC143155299 [Ptiloglossa arizonensis]|uniref:uncharacterized protein LOC143155299 n=1 Tax=Ptiloglossa arizonensis TaxID=3350558 RepID=UPI003F9EC727